MEDKNRSEREPEALAPKLTTPTTVQCSFQHLGTEKGLGQVALCYAAFWKPLSAAATEGRKAIRQDTTGAHAILAQLA